MLGMDHPMERDRSVTEGHGRPAGRPAGPAGRPDTYFPGYIVMGNLRLQLNANREHCTVTMCMLFVSVIIVGSFWFCVHQGLGLPWFSEASSVPRFSLFDVRSVSRVDKRVILSI